MTDSGLVEHLVGNVSPSVAAQILKLVSNSETFKQFANDYADKIRRKLGKAKTSEDKADVLAELEFAHCMLADSSFSLQYEPYGSSGRRNPDFLVCASGLQDFNLEVKRVRVTGAAVEFHEFEQAIIAAVHEVPSSLGVSFDFRSLDAPVELAARLRDATNSVIEQCIQAVRECESSLAVDQDSTFPIRGFEEGIQLTVSKVPGKPVSSPTAYFGGIWPVPYTQRESFKLSDLLLSCLGQLLPGMANVLAVRIHSSTHELQDLPEAIFALRARARSRDNDYFQAKGFEHAEDFLIQAEALSAVMVKSSWTPIPSRPSRNYVWCNRSAEVPLKNSVLAHLKAM
jgi:hypothetical protein